MRILRVKEPREISWSGLQDVGKTFQLLESEDLCMDTDENPIEEAERSEPSVAWWKALPYQHIIATREQCWAPSSTSNRDSINQKVELFLYKAVDLYLTLLLTRTEQSKTPCYAHQTVSQTVTLKWFTTNITGMLWATAYKLSV